MRRWMVVLAALACMVAQSGAVAAAGRIRLHDSGRIAIGGVVGDILPDPMRPVLYVADYTNGKVLELEVPTGRVLASVSVGAGPRSLALDPDGRYLYVAEEWTNAIGVVDLKARRRVAAWPVGTRPCSIVAGRSGRLYITTLNLPPGWSEYGDFRIMDTRTGALLGVWWNTAWVLPKAAISRNKTTVYVISRGMGPSLLHQIDVTTDTPVITRWTMPNGFPSDVWVDRHNARIYCDNQIYDTSLAELGAVPIAVDGITTTARDQYLLTVSSEEAKVWVWDPNLLTAIGYVSLPTGADQVRFSERTEAFCTTPGGNSVEMLW